MYRMMYHSSNIDLQTSLSTDTLFIIMEYRYLVITYQQINIAGLISERTIIIVKLRNWQHRFRNMKPIHSLAQSNEIRPIFTANNC